LIVGLGNPGPKYDATRHNVGWWAADHLVHSWRLGSFRSTGAALVVEGSVEDEALVVLKPTTYMNRSGQALRPFLGREGFDVSRDLMVLMDDATRDAGQARLRGRGSSGGHNGLRSIEAALGTREFARLRLGVGRPPPGEDLVQWVLSPMGAEDEDKVLAVIREVPAVLRTWMREGLEPAMNEINR
jgi:peptidyl-tRNA hydrolase, PTH1 family